MKKIAGAAMPLLAAEAGRMDLGVPPSQGNR
jgi:hypothetical protein